MAKQPLFPREAFHSTSGITHVCAAGESLPLRAHNAAFARYIKYKSAGHKGREEQKEELNEVQALISREWGVTSKEIGFVSSVAEGVSMIVEALDWEKGDNVCVDADDFPSLTAPFALKSQRNQQRPDNEGDKLPEMRYCRSDSLESTIDKKTRLIAVSYVSYLNGARVDLALYRQLADSVGATLLVDFTQAAGYTPIDASVADFAFSSCYKWLLGSTGVAIAYWNQARQPEWKPATAGWHSLSGAFAQPLWKTDTIAVRDDAMCFTRGNPSFLSIFILREALEYLDQWQTSNIESHVQTLTTELLDLLQREGIPSSTPKAKEKHGASVTVHCAGASEIVEELSKSGVLAWNGMGRVRFSFHGYNCLEDVERIMEGFPRLWRKFNV